MLIEESRTMNIEELFTKTYAAFNARDMETVLAIMHPEVDWPNGWEGGRVHGHDEVRQYWTRQWRVIDPIVTPERFVKEEDGRISVHVHQVVRDLEGNLISDGMLEHIYRIEDGFIKSMVFAWREAER
jgi:ketosteroid isomerase-like protein